MNIVHGKNQHIDTAKGLKLKGLKHLEVRSL